MFVGFIAFTLHTPFRENVAKIMPLTSPDLKMTYQSMRRKNTQELWPAKMRKNQQRTAIMILTELYPSWRDCSLKLNLTFNVCNRKMNKII